MQQNQTQIEPWLNPSPPIYLVLGPQCPCEIDKMYRERCVELRSLNSACYFFAHCRDTSCVLMTTVLLPSSFVVITIRQCIRLQVLFIKGCMFYKLTLDHAWEKMHPSLDAKQKNAASLFALQGEMLIRLWKRLCFLQDKTVAQHFPCSKSSP